MSEDNVLGILPTRAGKSLCYQLPALSRYDKTVCRTVLFSPLVVLMADQVAGLNAREIGSCVTVNGMLSMPARADALERIRLGDASIVLISPEQLRSVSLRRLLEQREIVLCAGRGPLPFQVGARLPARLPLRGPFHPGKGRRRPRADGAVPHSYGQA